MADTAKLREFIKNTPFVELITNGIDGYPNTRIFGHYANDGYDVYLSTPKGTQKTKEIAADEKVTAHYRVDGQPTPQYYSVTIFGSAEPIAHGGEDFKRAVALISARSASFKDKVENQGLDSTELYRLRAARVKVLDFSKGRGAAAIEEFKA